MKKENNKYAYVQVGMTMLNSIDTENREYAPFENIKDNYPKYIVTRNDLIQERNCIIHVNILEFMIGNKDYC